MHLHSKFGWVRAAGLVALLGLPACDSGTPDPKTEAKKPEPAKAVTDVKPAEPAPVPAKTDPVPGDVAAGDTKAADPAAGDTKAGDAAAGDTKAGDAAGDAKAGDAAGDTKAGDTKATDPKTTAKDPKAGATASKPKETAPTLDGKPFYDSKCKVCHGADGKGTEAQKKNNIPDMTDKAWQGAHNKAKVVAAIANGVDGTKMKAFKDKLKPEEIDAVAAYVKKMK